MRNTTIAFVIMILSNVGFAQSKSDIGFFAGGASYMGDVNMETPFRKVMPSVAVLYRYTLHSRIAFRADAMYAVLKGDDMKSSYDFQENRNYSFSSNFLAVSGLAEFNFLPFKLSDRYMVFSPYLLAGLGGMLHNFKIQPKVIENFIVPFGAGFQVGISKRLSVGIEYRMYKTFYDKLDNISEWRHNYNDDPSLRQWTNPQNNDWVTFFGVFVSYKLKSCVTCPAYF